MGQMASFVFSQHNNQRAVHYEEFPQPPIFPLLTVYLLRL